MLSADCGWPLAPTTAPSLPPQRLCTANQTDCCGSRLFRLAQAPDAKSAPRLSLLSCDRRGDRARATARPSGHRIVILGFHWLKKKFNSALLNAFPTPYSPDIPILSLHEEFKSEVVYIKIETRCIYWVSDLIHFSFHQNAFVFRCFRIPNW